MLLEVGFEVGGIDAVRLVGVKGALDRPRIGPCVQLLSLLLQPILHDHGDAGRATAILFLFYKRNIDPDARSFCGEQQIANPQERKQALSDGVHHATVLTDCHND